MVKIPCEESCLKIDWAAWPISLALALMAAGATLISLTGDLAAQGAGQNSVQAQIQRYGCNLPQYANSVPGCRALHARAKAKSSGRAAPRRSRSSGTYTRVSARPQPSSGGSFFGSLFGGGETTRRYSSSNRSRSRSGGSGGGWFGSYSPRTAGWGRYRTLCVRSCDGYYWPVSYSITRAGFSRDAAHCASSCAVPAELFVHRNPGSDIEQMVSLQGKAYSQTEHAFRYRVEYVKDCRCKPEPWSEAAKEDYAARLAVAKNPGLVQTASAEQAETPGVAPAPAFSAAPRRKTTKRRKARWRVRSDDAQFSGQWWAGSW